jgi:hypothetical protein
MEMKRVWSLYEVQANDLVYIRANPAINPTAHEFIIEIETDFNISHFKASYIAASIFKNSILTPMDIRYSVENDSLCFPENWEFYIIDYKNLVLYTHWSYKSKRFWELLERVYG